VAEENQTPETPDNSVLEQAMSEAVEAIEKREKSTDAEQEIDLLAEESEAKSEETEEAPKKDASSAVTEALIEAKRELEEALEQTRTQYSELRSKWMRAAADLENYKKRARREREEAIKFGNEKLIKDMLPVIDDLDRTLEVLSTSEGQEQSQGVIDGIRMVQKKFLSQLEKHEVTSFESVGQPFDPAQHEAVHQLHSNDVPAGGVVNEMRRGFYISGRLLRPSLVTVSLGAEPSSETSNETPSETSDEEASNEAETNADKTADEKETKE